MPGVLKSSRMAISVRALRHVYATVRKETQVVIPVLSVGERFNRLDFNFEAFPIGDR